jgi:iron complex outermembrane recepter protein
MCYLDSTPLLGRRNRFAIGAQYFGTRQADLNFANVQGDRGAKTKDQLNEVANAGIYTEEQFEATDTFTVVVGGRGQYAHRRVCDRFQTENDPKVDDSGTADYRSFTPKVGFIWQALPTMQVYGNASRAYEPPLILELTAPGQINGDLRRLKAQTSWQFEVGTRGKWGPRFAWDVSTFFEARNLADKQYISAITVDDANGRFFLSGDGRAFYGGISWRWR